MMMQMTVGCRFRRDFCDIIQFNGGFTRPKTLVSVRNDMEALLALGYRGGAFTVDDNFFVESRGETAAVLGDHGHRARRTGERRMVNTPALWSARRIDPLSFTGVHPKRVILNCDHAVWQR